MEQDASAKTSSPWVFAFVLLFCVELFLQIGLYGIRPIVSGYAVSLGATFALAGFLAGLMSLVALIARPLCGAVIDRFDRFKLMLATTLVLVVFSALCGIAQSIPAIAACESVRGVAFTFKSALITAITTLIIPKEKLGWGIGVINLGYTVSGAIGPLLSGFLLTFFDYPTCFFFASGISCVSLIMLVILKTCTPMLNKPKANAQETDSASAQTIEEAADRSTANTANDSSPLMRALKKLFYLPVLPYSLIGGILAFSYGCMLGLLYLVQDEGYIENASLYFVVFTAFVIVARVAGGRLSDIKGVKIVLPMIVISLVGSIPMILSGSTICLLIFAITMAFGQGPVFGILQADAMKHAPEEELGKVSNTSYIIMDLFMGISPFIGGVVLELFGCAGLFASITVFFAIGLVFTWILFKRRHII